MTLDIWLTRRGLNNTEFAEMIGVDRSQISRIRRRLQVPTPETGRKIVAVTKGQVGWRDLMVVG